MLSLAYMLAFGVTIAATTLVDRYLGAGKQHAAWQSARSCIALAAVGLGVLGTGLVLGRHGLVAGFNRDAAVQLLGTRLLLCVALFQVCQGLALVAAGILRGAGDTRWPMMVGVAISWGLFLPGAWLVMFPMQGGVSGGWLSALLYGIVLGLAMLLHVWRGGWRHYTLA